MLYEVITETVVHYTCRNKNMFGMISDLLGAAAAGDEGQRAGDHQRPQQFADETLFRGLSRDNEHGRSDGDELLDLLAAGVTPEAASYNFV